MRGEWDKGRQAKVKVVDRVDGFACWPGSLRADSPHFYVRLPNRRINLL